MKAAIGGATRPYTRLPIGEIGKALLLDAATLTISLNICYNSPTLKLGLLVAEAGCIVKLLQLYSPDHSPIELSFSILKAWMRRWFRRIWPNFDSDFSAFLRYAIRQSGCDSYAKEHFRYAGRGYMFNGDYEAFQQELEEWSRT